MNWVLIGLKIRLEGLVIMIKKDESIREYECNCCKGEFFTERSEKDVLFQKDVLFPDLNKEDQVLVCEKCFIKIMDFNEPQLKRYAPFIDKENMEA